MAAGGGLLIVVAGMGIRLAYVRANDFYRITDQLRRRGVSVSEGRPEWLHTVERSGIRVSYPYTDALQLDGIADADLPLVAEMTHLQMLRLDSKGVTDAGLVSLRPLVNLNWLVIACENVTDSGFQNLEGLRNLESLHFERAPITDRGLEHLRGLTKLKVLSFKDSKVTPAGIAKLKAALPGLTVNGL